MSITKMSCNILTLPDNQGVLALAFDPVDEDNILFERVGDRMVIAYLVNDHDAAFNPLEHYDGQGKLYTKSPSSARDSTITDNDSEFFRALGLDSCGEINPDSIVTIDGQPDSLWLHATRQVWLAMDEEELAGQLLACHEWHGLKLSGDQVEKLEGTPSRQLLTHLRREHEIALREDLEHPSGHHCDLVWAQVTALFGEHWKEIAGPLVVPVSHYSSSYDTTYSVATWDGDTDCLPDGVWVADRIAEECIDQGNRLNITVDFEKPLGQYRGVKSYWVNDNDRQVRSFETRELAAQFVEATYGDRPFDVATAARHYAEGVLSEYSKWCSGEVFGCVVHIYDLQDEGDDEPSWVQGSVEVGDECWGFIGEEYAAEALASEFFEPTVKRLQALLKPQFVAADDSEGGLTD